MSLSVSEVESLPGIGKGYIQNLKELKSFIELKLNISLDYKDEVDITSVDLSNMRLSTSNIDVKFLKALEKYNKLTKTTKHAKRHFWLTDVCTCHGLLPSHSA